MNTSPVQHLPLPLHNKDKHHIKTQGEIPEGIMLIPTNSLLKAKEGIAVAFLSRKALCKGGWKKRQQTEKQMISNCSHRCYNHIMLVLGGTQAVLMGSELQRYSLKCGLATMFGEK